MSQVTGSSASLWSSVSQTQELSLTEENNSISPEFLEVLLFEDVCSSFETKADFAFNSPRYPYLLSCLK